MRKKVAIGIGLVLLASVVMVLVVLWLPPTEPPLRVGMTEEEVRALLGEPETTLVSGPGILLSIFFPEPDWLGYNRRITIVRDVNSQVIYWNDEPLPRTRPPWLDRAMKWVRW
jgi:hypothetical protein